MFSYKRTFSALIILWIALFFVLYIISLITWPKEEILSTEVTYSNSTLSAIIFAGTDNSYAIEDIDADIVFEKNLSSFPIFSKISFKILLKSFSFFVTVIINSPLYFNFYSPYFSLRVLISAFIFSRVDSGEISSNLKAYCKHQNISAFSFPFMSAYRTSSFL